MKLNPMKVVAKRKDGLIDTYENVIRASMIDFNGGTGFAIEQKGLPVEVIDKKDVEWVEIRALK